MKNVIIVIPIYKRILQWYERISLKQALNIFQGRDMAFVAPRDLLFDYGEDYREIKTYRFSNLYFKSVKTYNKLMMSKIFYQTFYKYEYMLIYQLDAFVFSDQLNYFCGLKYDYIGAPWLHTYCTWQENKYRIHVGNGGFSLRRVKSMWEVTKNKDIIRTWSGNEDEFFSFCGEYMGWLNIAPKKVARMFSIERPVQRCFFMNKGEIPFGCHQWMLFGKDFYLNIFKEKCGIDLRLYQKYMYNNDENDEKNALSFLMLKRIKKYNAFCKYMSKMYKWSVVGAGKYGRALCRELLREGFDLLNLYDFDKNKQGIIYEGRIVLSPYYIMKGKEKIIVGSCAYESDISKMLEDMGLQYREDYILISRECYKNLFNG